MGSPVITVFEKIPPLFVELYDPQFKIWAAEFRTRGRRCAIVFNLKPGQPVPRDGEGRPIAAGAWLQAEVDRSRPQTPRVIIRPATPHDEEMIARHVADMRPHVLQ